MDAVESYLKAHFRPDVAADLLAAAQPLMAMAWDEGWQKAHSADDPAMAGIFFNPYRKTN